jgi:hypothetical protein
MTPDLSATNRDAIAIRTMQRTIADQEVELERLRGEVERLTTRLTAAERVCSIMAFDKDRWNSETFEFDESAVYEGIFDAIEHWRIVATAHPPVGEPEQS